MLTMNVDRETFDTIVSGKKHIIQKTASPFWVRRVARIVGIDPDAHDVGKIMRTAGHYKIKALKFEHLVLRCGKGQTPESDKIQVRGYAYMKRASAKNPETIWMVITGWRILDSIEESIAEELPWI